MSFELGQRIPQSKGSFLKRRDSAWQTFAWPISAQIKLLADGSKSLGNKFGDLESRSTTASFRCPCALPGFGGTTRVVIFSLRCFAQSATGPSEVKLVDPHSLVTGGPSAV